MYEKSRFAAATALLLAAGLLGAAPAHAAPQDDGWGAWIGCWELVEESEGGDALALTGKRHVCLEGVDEADTVEMTTWVDDEVMLLQQVVANGADRPVEEGGCAGTERARFSSDGQRILMSAELTCEGRTLRTSGISLLPGSSNWTDIQVTEVDGERQLLVRRYRKVDDGDRIAGAADDALLRRTLRQAASAPIDAEDVIEATRYVDPAAVEALLLESGDEFTVDADLLMALAAAEVPDNVIDLMVALSYPDYFAVHEGDSEEAWDRDRYRRGRWGWGPTFYSYGFYDAYFSPFRYPYYYRPFNTTIIYRGTPVYAGKVVKGRGYTRVTTRSDSSGGFSLGRLFGGRDSGRSAVGRGSGNNGSGTRVATPRSGSSGRSGRTAQPRGGSGSSGTAKPKSGGGSAVKKKGG